MILSSSKDAIHKAWLYRVLTEICDDLKVANVLRFKGGTCMAMRGFLDRFSIDLDFDYVGEKKDVKSTEKELEKIFKKLGLIIKDKSNKVPQYFLKYPVEKISERNTIKIDVTFPSPVNNKYEAVRLLDIDRIIYCQTVETAFANKLVALIERFEKNGSIAGRDIYDIHHFFISALKYEKSVILERRNIKDLKIFFKQLIEFVEDKITEIIISQDLNTLIAYDKFKKIRKTLKAEVLMFLRDELNRLKFR